MQRYGRDRITNFMNLEYIEDFESIVTIVKKLMNMNHHEVLFLTFVQFDYNKDGLITNSDLLDLFRSTKGNTLIERDLFRILDYLKQEHLKDRPSNPELFVTDLNYQGLKLTQDE